MNSDRRLLFVIRTLRVGITVLFSCLCLATLFFWVRSYWYADGGFVKILPSEYIKVHALEGRMCLWFEHSSAPKWLDWHSRKLQENIGPDAENRMPWFNLAFWPTFARLYLSHPLLFLVSGTLAAVPWCPRKFSTRGLLTTTAALAVVLSLVLWVDKTF